MRVAEARARVHGALFLVIAVACCGVAYAQDTVDVDTAHGTVRGAVLGQVEVFRALPYAEPPVGDLRWRPTMAFNGSWDGVRDATASGPPCVQGSEADASEDCLLLDVWRPVARGAAPLPVMVWIHGGSFTSGSAELYSPTRLCEEHGVVVVVMQYRLGVLGFMALEELRLEDLDAPTTGNYGLLDQRMALEWVRGHIERFGGDHNRVTVFGESAGAISIFAHLTLPKSNYLFHRAIAQSGYPEAVSLNNALYTSKRTVWNSECFGQHDAALLACLRELTPSQLRRAVPEQEGMMPLWWPTIDGFEIATHPARAFAKGEVPSSIPLLTGTTRNEGTVFIYSTYFLPADADVYRGVVESHVAAEDVDTVLALYPPVAGDNRPIASELVGDFAFHCPTQRAASAHQGTTYVYTFGRAPACRPAYIIEELGVFHASDLWFVFPPFMPYRDCALTADEERLSQQVIEYWARFAHDGNPNGGSAEGTAVWPAWRATGDVLDLRVPTLTTVPDFKADQCANLATVDPLVVTHDLTDPTPTPSPSPSPKETNYGLLVGVPVAGVVVLAVLVAYLVIRFDLHVCPRRASGIMPATRNSIASGIRAPGSEEEMTPLPAAAAETV